MTAESCRKPKTNNQQLLKNKLELKSEYEVSLRLEIQIWKPGPDLKMKNLENEELNSRFTLKSPLPVTEYVWSGIMQPI